MLASLKYTKKCLFCRLKQTINLRWIWLGHTPRKLSTPYEKERDIEQVEEKCAIHQTDRIKIFAEGKEPWRTFVDSLVSRKTKEQSLRIGATESMLNTFSKNQSSKCNIFHHNTLGVKLYKTKHKVKLNILFINNITTSVIWINSIKATSTGRITSEWLT